MKTADRKDMCNSEPGEGLPVLGGNQGTHAKQQSGCIGTGFFSERITQGKRKTVTDFGD